MDSVSKHYLLKKHFGYDTFRPGQEQLIDSILSGRDVLGIMPTGSGKSICFWISALMLDGISLVVSPLISLMKDQVNVLKEAGIKAAFINSSLTPKQISLALNNARNGIYKIIYAAPERLLSGEFLNFVSNTLISMLVIDEAHCVSQWGHDFRPSYLKILDFINTFKNRPIVSTFTATATPRVRKDIMEILKLDNPDVLITGFNRKNLYFEVQKPIDKFTALINFLQKRQGKSGIIYCNTRKAVNEVCSKLCESGYSATSYHAGMFDMERMENQDDFIFDRKQIMVATNAFGMGIDKSNVSYVVHYNMPKDIESYYQEAGRAGRDGSSADCVLFYHGHDVRINLYLIENSKDVEYVDSETEALVKSNARERLKLMTFYCHTGDCLRTYLLKYFGEKYCGEKINCTDNAANLYYCCNNCNSSYDYIDVTIKAQKILSCIKRMNERYGIRLIIDTLRGSKNGKLFKLGLNKLSTYSIMNNDSENQIRNIINFLVTNEYIFITNDEFPIVKLTTKASDVLFGKVKLEMKQLNDSILDTSKYKKEKQRVNINAVNPELMNILKGIRKKIADKQKIPAFLVFSDATLADMCMKLPDSKEDFLNVSGVGQFKLEKYGNDFLKAIILFKKKD